MFIGGGLSPGKDLPEVDAYTLAARVTAPTLTINGVQDFVYPLETSSDPLFRALGPPDAQKRHLLVEGGHLHPVPQVTAEISRWLDRYLGEIAEPENESSGNGRVDRR